MNKINLLNIINFYNIIMIGRGFNNLRTGFSSTLRFVGAGIKNTAEITGDVALFIGFAVVDIAQASKDVILRKAWDGKEIISDGVGCIKKAIINRNSFS